MGILGLGDHVAAIRPEDISGQGKQTRGQSSTSKKGNWGHLLVTVATLIQGSSADCFAALKKVNVPECKSCSKDSSKGCADVEFYTFSKNGEEPLPYVDHKGNPYLWIGHGEENKEYVCESMTSDIDITGETYIHSARINLENCYDYEEFDQRVRLISGLLKIKDKREVYKEFKEKQKFERDLADSAEDFDISRQILEGRVDTQGAATVVLPSPISTYLGGISTSSMLPLATPAPALR